MPPSFSPEDARHYKKAHRRVAFDSDPFLADPLKPAGLFSQLASMTSMAPAASSNRPRGHQPNGSQQQQQQHSSHHRHASSHRNGHADRRARVEDASDDDDDDDGDGDGSGGGGGGRHGSGRHGSGRKAKSKSAAASSSPMAAAAAAQPPGFSGVNPALGANPVFVHSNGLPLHPQPHPQQPYAIQAYPGFLPAMAAPPGFAMPGTVPGATTTTAVHGGDPSAVTGISFLPAVPDAINGPMVHTYIPRCDPGGGGGGGGFIYVQQPQQPGYPTAPGVPLAGVPIATTTAPMMPFVQQQQPVGLGQPFYIQQQQPQPQPQPAVAYAMGGYGGGGGGGGGCAPPVVMMAGMPGGGPGGSYGVMGGGMPGMVHPEPALGIGQTPGEVLQEQLEFAYANNMYEPQDFKPADDDKSRFYWVRELDGNWTQRSRATIDHIGCRWYITDSGVFYAVRLPD